MTTTSAATTASAPRPHATLAPLGDGAVSWAGGFWGEVARRCRETTVPSIWGSLSDPAVSPGWRNFLVAAGREEGVHEGPPFLDGDLYKWLEAAVSLLATGPDADLERVVEEVVEVVAEIQREDGYLHTPTLIAARNAQAVEALADRFHFETYNLGHLITAGVVHHRVTGRRTLLRVARRAAGFLEHLAADDPDGLARSAICPSHYMAVVELYRATGEDRWLRLAESFVRVRDDFSGGDDNQDRVPIREQQVVAGHAVRANYLYAGLADLVIETGDEQLRRVLERLWRDVVDTKLYLTGGCGALYDGASPDAFPEQGEISRVHQAYGRPYQLPSTTAHNESCANIGMMLWSRRMLELTGEPRYADVVEQVVCNSLLASIGLDAESYLYTNPLRQVRGLPFPLRRPGDTALHPVPAPPPSDERLRQRYLSVFCCPPNIARTLAQLHGYVASVSPAGVAVHLYGDADIRAVLPDGDGLELRLRSRFPWEEGAELDVEAVHGAGLPVRLRIPAWCTGATVSVDGVAVEDVRAGREVVLERDWRPGTRIRVGLPMPVRVQRSHRLAEEIQNQVAVTRGPLVYCLESTDLPPGVRLEQVALRRDVRLTPVAEEVAGHPVVTLHGEGVLLPLPGDDALYTDVEQDALGRVQLRLVPYFTWGNRGPSEMSVWLPVVW
ncbi:glycoside hydrolase family 127 protein [Desertihabitans aurantiacus]|uniref:glycoside hydrolase family 127 protein n=1 Tax=Desertihabitans aurantiacus TaxID=2282477 RepID=UPI000DF83224|nr:beta-L-arabinofuranosidase domain-containing protein [Desertihabitans aurantiacus]